VSYLLDAPARHSWLILMRKYDAFTTDYAYETNPASLLGPLGRSAARRVMNYPLHVAMRERLAIVAGALAEAVERRPGSARVLSAPCGLGRDLITAAGRLGPRAAGVTWEALDLDARGDVIPEARRRTAAVGLPVAFHREDLLDPAGLAARARTEPYDVVNCIGLATWLSLAEVERLARFFHDSVLRPGGALVIDNWAPHAHSRSGEDLEIFAEYHAPDAFRASLEAAGFAVERAQTTSNGACTVYVTTAR
jgi:SAM-dependent methyltransferase